MSYDPTLSGTLRKNEFVKDRRHFLLSVGFCVSAVSVAFCLYSHSSSTFAVWASPTPQSNVSDDHAKPKLVAQQGLVDFALWSDKRIQAYKKSLGLKIDRPLGVLSIPRLQISAPVYDGTDDLTLDRGLGRIIGTGTLGNDHNIGIAGHRDGFFRALKDIEVGDVVQISLSHSDDTYVVNTVLIVKPEDISVLRDRSGAGLTLVTCYPFYFVGHAPTRFIVEASLKERVPRVPSAASNRTPTEKSR